MCGEMMSNMHDLDILQELIKREATASFVQTSGKPTVTLEESGSCKNNSYSVVINGLPEDIIIIKADKFPSPDNFFIGNKGERKRADYIIVAQDNNKNWIVHIEMKSREGDNKKIVQQLKGAQCLVAYCRAIGRAFWQVPKFLEEKNYQQCFVSITDIITSMDKTPTRIPSKSTWHDTPENKLRIKAPGNKGLRFDKLVGKPHH